MTLLKTINNISKGLLFLLPTIMVGQTVNNGQLYISPGTVFSTVPPFDNRPTGTLINDGDAYVYSTFNNDGVVDFMGNTGLTRFVGTTPQIISGINFSYLYDAQFDNPAAQPAFQLLGNVSVANESEFLTGIVDTDNYGGTFVFENDATQVMTSDESHVDGEVTKIGDSSFEYPIGDGGYFRLAGISGPDEVTDMFTSKYFFEPTDPNFPVANMGPDLTLIDSAEHWTIERTSGISDVLITLSWRNITTPSEILVAPFEAIHIVRWDPALMLWVDEGGVVDVDNKTVTTAVDSYGVFTLARVKNAAVLPCALTVYNLITPNEDGLNDLFEIKQAVNDNTCARNMSVKIFDRWGIKVFEADNYNQGGDKFTGKSDARLTIARDKGLPTGTYFYILTYDHEVGNNTQSFKKAGYLYINGQ